MRKHIIFIIAALVLPSCLMAQQRADSTMQQTLTLERDFSPIVQNSNKIDIQPAPQTFKATKTEAVFADWEADAVRSSEIGVIQAGQVVARRQDPTLGYLQLSGGNNLNADLRAGIHSGDFALDADGFCSNSYVDLLKGRVRGTYSHTLASDGQLSAHVTAQGLRAEHFRKHHGGSIGADFGYENDAFRLLLGYSFQSVMQSHENVFSASMRYGLYDRSDLWQAYIDLPLGIALCSGSNYFTVKPELHLTFTPSDGQWKRYDLSLAAGTRRPELYSVLQQLLLVDRDTEYGTTIDVFDAKLSFANHEQGYLRWGLSASARMSKHALGVRSTWMPQDETLIMLWSPFFVPGSNLVFTSRDDLYLAAEAYFNYEYSRYFGINAKACFQKHSSREASLGAPTLMGSFHMVSHPGNVSIDLGFDTSIDRQMRCCNLAESGYIKHNLKNIYDLNFRLDWQVRPSFSVTAFGNNLLNRKTELLPYVKDQGINLHVGLKWVF